MIQTIELFIINDDIKKYQRFSATTLLVKFLLYYLQQYFILIGHPSILVMCSSKVVFAFIFTVTIRVLNHHPNQNHSFDAGH